MKLTKKTVDNLKLPEEGQVLVWDSELKGFGIRLTSGGMSYFVQGRANGKSRRITIGKHGIFTPEQARIEAKEKLRDMAKGIDPKDVKKTNEALAITLAEVGASYIKDRALKKNSIRDINIHLNGIFQGWKDQPITNISRDMVLKLFRKRSEESPSQANQAFRVLRGLFNYAMATYRPGDKPIILENPVKVISDAKVWNVVKAKNRRIPINQVGRAWNILKDIQENPVLALPGRSMVDAVIFCLLTGCRWSEAQTLPWEDVNLEAGTWFIRDPKNKESVTLPLSGQAKILLENRSMIAGNGFVFCSNKSKTGYIGPGRWVTDQIAKDLKIEFSPHDLRRTFRSIAAELDIELWRTKLLMNHKIRDDVTIQSYTEKDDLGYLRPSIQAIGDWIEKKGQEAAAGNVVDIGTKRQAV
jgi:integrase